ncbi:MAG: hypothetical protein JXL80_15305 [Planctomycetes bacterium]|nr:hypothetical protein [Planctomycetota bacterium]
MNQTRSQPNAMLLVLSGAIGALVVVAAAWGVWMWLQPDEAEPAAVLATPPDAPAESPVETPVPAVEPEPAPVAVAAVGNRAEAEPALGPESVDVPEKTPEEILMEKARKSAEQYAEQANTDDGFEEEQAFLEARFDQRKKQFMDSIDGYFAQPEDKRDEYLRKIGEEFRKQSEAERLEAGLPAQPRNQGRMWAEFMRMSQEKMTDEEKAKVKDFMNDMVKRQVARFQAEMERQLNSPPRQ